MPHENSANSNFNFNEMKPVMKDIIEGQMKNEKCGYPGCDKHSNNMKLMVCKS